MYVRNLKGKGAFTNSIQILIQIQILDAQRICVSKILRDSRVLEIHRDSRSDSSRFSDRFFEIFIKILGQILRDSYQNSSRIENLKESRLES